MARSRNRNQKRNQRVSRRRVQTRRSNNRNSRRNQQSRSRSRSQSRNRNVRRSRRVRRRSSRGGAFDNPTIEEVKNKAQALLDDKDENKRVLSQFMVDLGKFVFGRDVEISNEQSENDSTYKRLNLLKGTLMNADGKISVMGKLPNNENKQVLIDLIDDEGKRKLQALGSNQGEVYYTVFV